MSDRPRPDLADALIREGAASYLDALYALHRFRLEVTDRAIVVWNEKYLSLVNAIGIQGAATTNFVRYCEPSDINNECDGNWAWVAARTFFQEPLNINGYLGLSFERKTTGELSEPHVTFMCQSAKKATFDKIKGAFRGRDYYYTNDVDRECGFYWKPENPLLLEEEFKKMMNYVIEVWRGVGGWDGLNKLPA